ncbi:MAG: hypothetical protein SFV17_15615 [Candidatus Obscuribacter sp.]|nr:hypothetical protein [Candidatus Obscuribacter sp.]
MSAKSFAGVEERTDLPVRSNDGSGSSGEGRLQAQADALRFGAGDPGKSGSSDLGKTEVARVSDQKQPPVPEGDVTTFKSQNQALERIGGALFRDSAAPHLEHLQALDPASGGAITRQGMRKFLKEVDLNGDGKSGNQKYPQDFVQSVAMLERGFDSPSLKAFKDENGNISKESYTKGIFSRQDRLAALEEKATAVKPGGSEEKALNGKLKDASVIKAGEGPFAAAQRILESMGGEVSRAELRQLTRALKEQYIAEHGGKKNSINSLKVGHAMLDNPRTLEGVLGRLKNDSLKERLTRASLATG